MLLLNLFFSQECEEPENVWFKISNNPEHMYGKIMSIDMSRCYADTDGYYIYLFLLEKNTKEELIIQFPIGWWEVETFSKKIPQKENKEEFDLDEYLKKNKGKGIKIAKP